MKNLKRNIQDQLMAWKKSFNRRPLILKGMRQTGKTLSVLQFGEQNFRKVHNLNFLEKKELVTLFEELQDFEPENIIKRISIYLRTPISITDDLLFFDEIQESNNALLCLKFFAEKMPEISIIGAGSYLGIMKNESSFPVGKVDFLTLNPLSFAEFLLASDPELYDYYASSINVTDILNRIQNPNNNILGRIDIIPDFIHERLLSEWKYYLIVGGMPEVVKNFIRLKNKESNPIKALAVSRKIQKRLLEGFQSDFVKHSGVINAANILHVFNAVAMQLGKTQNDDSVSKFKFSKVIPGQNGLAKISSPLMWLIKSRLIIKTPIANHAEHPIIAHTSENRFKIYFSDIGLLNAMLNSPYDLHSFESLGIYKGYIVENFVAQEFFNKIDLLDFLVAWSEGDSEIEFIINNSLIPVEVKSSKRINKSKSLESFINRYNPPFGIILSGKNVEGNKKKKSINLPIYLAGKLKEAFVINH